MANAIEHDYVERLFLPLSEVTFEKKQYIYNPYFPIKKIGLSAGDPGIGKTKFILLVCALITQGKDLCGIPCEKPGSVLIFSREDDSSDIRKTVEACGGDSSKIYVVSESDDALDLLDKNELKFSSPIIEMAVARFQPSFVLFDPLQAYIGRRINMNAANETSGALAPLLKIAQKYDCHIHIISHNRKDKQNGLQSQVLGSVNLAGQARSILSIVRDPTKDENIVIHTKSNNRKGLSIRYKIKPIPTDPDFATVELIGREKYSERDYREAEQSRLRQKLDEMINDSSPVVATVLQLANDNPGGVKIGRADLNDIIESQTGEVANYPLSTIAKEYGHYLGSKHGIAIVPKDKQRLKAFCYNGETITPSKIEDRSLYIIKK